ncbi:thiol peroxidase [Kocuria palustris]|uniref:thiol peroxidase n=1 Tax=Kocuria palustris TaxID=71999 RepID=UPI0011A66022|nr:thiol peroxidase [Kocuria palustris]
MDTAFKAEPVRTVDELPRAAEAAPDFDLVGSDLGSVRASDFSGRRVVLNIFPSVDTGTCAASVRRFNELAAGFENTAVVCVSKDLPFAQERFCGAEGIEGVTMASAFRSSFGEDYGVTMADGPLAGLLARSVVVIDPEGSVVYTQLVDEIANEPDYQAVVSVLS